MPSSSGDSTICVKTVFLWFCTVYLVPTSWQQFHPVLLRTCFLNCSTFDIIHSFNRTKLTFLYLPPKLLVNSFIWFYVVVVNPSASTLLLISCCFCGNPSSRHIGIPLTVFDNHNSSFFLHQKTRAWQNLPAVTFNISTDPEDDKLWNCYVESHKWRRFSKKFIPDLRVFHGLICNNFGRKLSQIGFS